MDPYLISIILLLGLSAFFSASETALISLSDVRTRTFLKKKSKKNIVEIILSLKAKPTRLLTAVLIGNNLVNVSISALATIYFTKLFGNWGPGLAIGLITFLVLVFGEIIPKSLAVLKPEKVSFLVAKPIQMSIRKINLQSALSKKLAFGN